MDSDTYKIIEFNQLPSLPNTLDTTLLPVQKIVINLSDKIEVDRILNMYNFDQKTKEMVLKRSAENINNKENGNMIIYTLAKLL